MTAEASLPSSSTTEDRYVLARFGGEIDQRWNPFVSADDDLQVLERVRAVWPIGTDERIQFFSALPSRGFMDEYEVGAWSVAALAVLREMEEG